MTIFLKLLISLFKFHIWNPSILFQVNFANSSIYQQQFDLLTYQPGKMSDAAKVAPLLGGIWFAVVVIVLIICNVAFYGGIAYCIYYCIKSNQNQRTAAMAQHQMAYQQHGMSEKFIIHLRFTFFSRVT